MSKQKVNCAKGTREADLGHAVLSASGSHRWLNCTPSARLELEFENTTSEAAREGTAAHALCEHKLKKLCEYSLLSDNAYPTYAVTKKKLKASGVKMEKQASVSEDIGCVVLELGYFIDFFGKGLQDPLSVALSLTREEQEERVKISVNEMLEEYVWSKD